jgi:leucine dehydrogenase
MQSLWDHPDFDAHEAVHFATDVRSGLKVIIAIHSTFRGPAAGGTRFWHYPRPEAAIADALRLSRGMSFKNAMAGLPMGGGKAVILAPEGARKDAALLEAYGRVVDSLCGRYVTAADVGITVADLIAVSAETRFISGLPAADGAAGGDSGPHTAYGVFLGIKAAARRMLGKDSLDGVHIALQGAGSVGGGLARLAAAEGARLSIADVDGQRASALAQAVGGVAVDPADIMAIECDVLSPCALGAILNETTIPALRTAIVAGGANNQLARPEDGVTLAARGILYAPDYVINAGGIINVALEYLGGVSGDEVRSRIEQIPGRLDAIWEESAQSGRDPAAVADSMARALIGRA